MNPEQRDTLRELVNIGVGRAANTLNVMLDTVVKLAIPDIRICNVSELGEKLAVESDQQLATIHLNFQGAFSGATSLVFPAESAEKLVRALAADHIEDDEDQDALRVGMLTEIGNIVINNVMGTLGNLLGQSLNYSLPAYHETDVLHLAHIGSAAEEDTVILTQADFTLPKLHIHGTILLWFRVESVMVLTQAIDQMNAEV